MNKRIKKKQAKRIHKVTKDSKLFRELLHKVYAKIKLQEAK